MAEGELQALAPGALSQLGASTVWRLRRWRHSLQPVVNAACGAALIGLQRRRGRARAWPSLLLLVARVVPIAVAAGTTPGDGPTGGVALRQRLRCGVTSTTPVTAVGTVLAPSAGQQPAWSRVERRRAGAVCHQVGDPIGPRVRGTRTRPVARATRYSGTPVKHIRDSRIRVDLRTRSTTPTTHFVLGDTLKFFDRNYTVCSSTPQSFTQPNSKTMKRRCMFSYALNFMAACHEDTEKSYPEVAQNRPQFSDFAPFGNFLCKTHGLVLLDFGVRGYELHGV